MTLSILHNLLFVINFTMKIVNEDFSGIDRGIT